MPFKGAWFKGFTLAELLVSLAVLGLLATFAVPKVLQTVSEQQQKAVLREVVATLSAVTFKAIQNNGASREFFRENLQYQRLCANHPNEEGCWAGNSAGDATNKDGYLLHNGATLTSFNGVLESVAVDLNGTTGPNIFGVDQIWLWLCLSPAGCATDIGGTGFKGQGAVGPLASTPSSVNRYQALMRN